MHPQKYNPQLLLHKTHHPLLLLNHSLKLSNQYNQKPPTHHKHHLHHYQLNNYPHNQNIELHTHTNHHHQLQMNHNYKLSNLDNLLSPQNHKYHHYQYHYLLLILLHKSHKYHQQKYKKHHLYWLMNHSYKQNHPYIHI